jgi:hypothetical protein
LFIYHSLLVTLHCVLGNLMANTNTKKTTEKPLKKREFKLDIWKVLEAADQCNINFMNSLTEEEKKALFPVVIMRWMSAVSNQSGMSEHYITTVNELVNVQLHDIAKHPELQWKLLALCGVGLKQRHNWIPLNRTNLTSKLDNLVLQVFPHLNELELDIVKSKFTEANLREYCRDFAMADSEIKSIVEDFRKYKNHKAERT